MSCTGLLPAADGPGLSAAGAATPFLKWGGGKRWLVPHVGLAIRARLAARGGRYIEPFLGGGALALWLGASRALLGDTEAPLMEAYRCIATEPDAVAQALGRLVRRGTTSASYYAVRAARPRSAPARAARLLYLNKLAFNGLYRTDRRGRFNVPAGRHVKPSFPDLDLLRRAARALTGAALCTGDFEALVLAAGPGDVIFADPPYHGRYGGYSARPFTERDQARLAAALEAAVRRGAAVVATNADTDAVRRWYAWAAVSATAERRSIAARPGARGRARCVLITSDPSLVRGAP